MTIQSDPAAIAPARRAIEALAAALGMSDRAVGDVGLCVNEALANVIRHAYGGARGRPIKVTAHCQDAALAVMIRDWGNGVNPATLPPRPYDPHEPGGLGLICLRRMMTRVEYVPQADGGMLLVMTRDLKDDDRATPAAAADCAGDDDDQPECGHE
jgi:anti-sigma regulatory factor (Ser/Thr protein kinase)